MIKISRHFLTLTLIITATFNFYLWQVIVTGGQNQQKAVYFLDVGQGDGQFITLPPINILIDGGRDSAVLKEIDKILGGLGNKYIDLMIMTHADSDHFGGLDEVVRNYGVGTFIFNGEVRENKNFEYLFGLLNKEKVPIIALAAGDRIKYLNNEFFILSPDHLVDERNENSLVILMNSTNNKTLFTGDIGKSTENKLVNRHNLEADILKVAHHGSKNSSGINFINEVNPYVSIVSVGRNSYGHPHPQVLDNLAKIGSLVYRTDKTGTIKINLE